MNKRKLPLLLSFFLLGLFIFEAFAGQSFYTIIASLAVAGVLSLFVFLPALLSLLSIKKRWLEAIYAFSGLGLVWTAVAALLFPGSVSYAALAGLAALAIGFERTDSFAAPNPPDYPQAPENESISLQKGQTVPADGTISEGVALVDESNVEGEWIPQVKKTGDVVYSGSKITEGAIQLHCERTGVESFFYKVATLNDTFTYPPISGFSTIIAPYMFFITIAIFAIGCIISIFTGFYPELPGLLCSSTAIAGLGLSKGIQLFQFNNRAMYCNNTQALVQAANTTTLLLDSRSIISLKQFTVSEVISDHDPEELMNFSYALSAAASNPYALAVNEYAGKYKTRDISIDTGEEGNSIRILETSDSKGKAEYEMTDLAELKERNIDYSSYEIDLNTNLASAGEPYFLLKNNELFGMFILKEVYKNIPFSEIPGCRTNLIAGEDKMKTIIAANELDVAGIIHAPRPADRAKTVEELQNRAEVVSYAAESMSGIAALKQADTGISISTKLPNCSAWVATPELLPYFFSRSKSLHESERISTLISLVYMLVMPVVLFMAPGLFAPLLFSTLFVPPALLMLFDMFFSLTKHQRPAHKASEDIVGTTEQQEVQNNAGETE